jgi:hypothetical protein
MAGFTGKKVGEGWQVGERSEIAVYETDAGNVSTMITLKYADGSFMARKYPDGRNTPFLDLDLCEDFVAVWPEIKKRAEDKKAELAAKGPKAPKGNAAKPPSAAQQQQLVMMEIMQQMLAELRAGKKSK